MCGVLDADVVGDLMIVCRSGLHNAISSSLLFAWTPRQLGVSLHGCKLHVKLLTSMVMCVPDAACT